MKLFDNALAVIGLFAVMSSPFTGPAIAKHFEKKPQPVAYFEPRMIHPIQCDATMAQRGANEKWSRPKCYIRSDK